MFDQNTIGLISDAPEIKQIDLKNLSKEFTKVYAEIVTGRAQLQRGDASEATGELISRMKKIALTYEGLLAINSERPNMRSIAFIAASAHHLVFLAQQTITDSSIDSKLATHMISSDISAALLFVISGYMSDAKNMANLISISGDDNDIKTFLLKSIVALIYGNLESILEYNLDDLYIDDSDQLAMQATNALYLMLLQGIQLLAKELLDINKGSSFESFQNTYNLCSENIELVNSMSTYSGPRYLAMLLKLVSKSLISKATVHINNHQCKQLDEAFLKRLAKNTPYLFENDLTVLNTEYLNSDVSSVIRRPIGMDYYSILSLKIIATWTDSQKKTLLLVEDRYSLYKATSRLKNIFGDEQIQTYQYLDSSKANIVLVVTVQDLIEILKKPDFIQLNIGLFVIEECAILGNTFNIVDVSVEPMFALLSFLDKFPSTTMLLFTSKIQNIQDISEWIGNITNNLCLPILLESKPARQAKGLVVYDKNKIEENDGQDIQPLGLFSLEQNWVSQVSGKNYSLVKLSDTLVSLSRNQYGKLKPNKYVVSTLIAEHLALPKCKVVVFTDRIDFSMSKLTNQIKKDIYLNDEETGLYSQCIDEFGGDEELYLKVDESGYVISSGVCDFNLLLPIERILYRSLFQRQDGLDLLITKIRSSSFKNLSYNVAVIAGHQQFDSANKRPVSYNKQELLEQIHHIGIYNHSSSNGLAIMVPSDVIQIQKESKEIPSEIIDIYSNDEYESELYDPLTNILDNLTLNQSINDRELPLVRLIYSETGDDSKKLIESIVNKSYISYKRNDVRWKKLQVDQLSILQEEYREFSLDNRFADSLNISTSLFTHVSRILNELQTDKCMSVLEWHSFIFNLFLKDCLALKEYFLHLLSSSYYKEKDDEKIPDVQDIEACVTLWVAGCSIQKIANRITKPKHVHNKNLLWYRKLLYICLPEYLKIIDIISAIYEYVYKKSAPLSLQCLSDCSRYGFDCYEKLVLYRILEEKINRREIHRVFDKLDIAKHPSLINETYEGAWGRVSDAYQKYKSLLD